jgi:putative tryptophan/tyrosine transport system substrate-binding protein
VNRRRFVAGAGAGALLSLIPPIARAQGAMRRVAWASPGLAAEGSLFLDALRQGLRDRGYGEGRNLAVEAHWGDGVPEKIAQLAPRIVASRPEVIVAQGPTAIALRAANAPIPVVFGYSGDPVEAGLVSSLARPGGNLTGITFLTLDLVGKRIEFLKQALPKARSVAVIANPQHPGDPAERRISEHAADANGMTLEYFEARNGAQLMEALARIEKTASDAVMLFPVQFIIANRERVAAWSARTRIPTMSGWSQFVEGGNLMSYGPALAASFRRLAAYVDRILKGTRPAELAVEQPTEFELVINRKAARALGIAIPQSLLLRADRVIE